MKTIVRIATIACGLFITSATMAQDKAAPKPANYSVTTTRAPMDPSAPVLMPMNIAAYGVQLKMTPEQIAKAKDIDMKYQGLAKDLGNTLTPEQRTAEMRKLMTAHDGEVKAVLTPEQVKSFFSMMRQPTGAPVSGSAPGQPSPSPAVKPEQKK